MTPLEMRAALQLLEKTLAQLTDNAAAMSANDKLRARILARRFSEAMRATLPPCDAHGIAGCKGCTRLNDDLENLAAARKVRD